MDLSAASTKHGKLEKVSNFVLGIGVNRNSCRHLRQVSETEKQKLRRDSLCETDRVNENDESALCV